MNDKTIPQVDISMKLQESKQFWNIKNEIFQAIALSSSAQESNKISPSEIHRISQGMGLEEQLKKLIGSFIQKKVRKEPIHLDKLEFINQTRIKWTELLYKNYIIMFEKSKSEDEDQTSKDLRLHIYDHQNLLNFIIAMKQQTGAQVLKMIYVYKVFRYGEQLDLWSSTHLAQYKEKKSTGDKRSNIIIDLLRYQNQFALFLLTFKYYYYLFDIKQSVQEFKHLIQFLIKLYYQIIVYYQYKIFLVLRRQTNLGLSNDEFHQEKYQIKQKKVRKIIENECLENEIETFAQEGVPHGDRSELLVKYFEIEGKENQYQQLVKRLEKEATQSPIFLDDVMEQDCQEILENDQYFVFQEQIQRVLKVTLRDSSLKERLAIIYQQLDMPFENEYALQLPSSGFLPCKNISFYIAPFCYLSTKTHLIYALFSQFFCKYVCFLHSISSHPNSILSVSLIFEDIMNQTQFKLMQHLREVQMIIKIKKIGCDALKIVFPMMQFLFIGYLDIEQIFYIIDRILGFQGLDILALIAAGLLKQKSVKLMTAKGQSDINQIMSELSEENAMDLILTCLNEL